MSNVRKRNDKRSFQEIYGNFSHYEGLTFRSFAKELGATPASFSRWANGSHRPSLKSVQIIIDTLERMNIRTTALTLFPES